MLILLALLLFIIDVVSLLLSLFGGNGAAAAGGRTAGLTGARGVFKGKGYAGKMDNFMTQKGYSDLAHPDFGKFKSVARPGASAKRITGQTKLSDIGALTMGPDKYRTFCGT